MVAELSVALDMAHHFLASLRLDPSVTHQLKHAVPSGNGGSAAYDAIEACKNVDLWPDATHEGKQMQFHHILSIFLAIFQQRKRSSDLPVTLAGIQNSANSTEFPLFNKPLRAWEYQQLRTLDSNVHVEKQIKTSNNDPQVWWKIIQDPNILVLTGQDFEQVIRPSSEMSEQCRAWKTIPEGKQLLTASMPCLKKLSKNNGYVEFAYKPHKSLRWHRPPNSKLFEHCTPGQSCVRIQELRKVDISRRRFTLFDRSQTTTVISPTTADLKTDDPKTTGAVVFGNFHAHEQKERCVPGAIPSDPRDQVRRHWG